LERIAQKRPATPMVCGRLAGLALQAGIASVDEIYQDLWLQFQIWVWSAYVCIVVVMIIFFNFPVLPKVVSVSL
jgi:hypothetical protein